MSDVLGVYVVDDDPAIVDSLTALFTVHGIPVRGFGSAQSFMEAFDPGWRGCLLLDVGLPVIDGLTLQRELANRDCTLPVIMITGHADVPLAVQAMKAGAVDFIEKPLDPAMIVDRVREHLAHAVIGEAVAEPAEEARLSRLTPRERQVFEQLVIGASNKAIARTFGISPRTVEFHRARVMEKMEARNLSHLVRMGLAAGIGEGI